MVNPLSIIAGPLINGFDKLGKTFFGSKEQRDEQGQEQFMAVQGSYQSEQVAPEKKNWFNILVDAYNRIQRPAMTTGVIALFIWAAIDPLAFTITMKALSAVPEMLWYILASVVAFWFSGRILEKAPMKIDNSEIKTANKIAEEVKKDREDLDNIKFQEDKYEEELKDTTKPLSNQAILEWNRRNNKSQ
jgi:hypothetical protein